MERKFRLTPTFWHSISPKFSRKEKLDIALKEWSNTSQHPLKCFKCHKYGQHRQSCRRRQTCARCGDKDPDYMEEDCSNEIKCPNCRQNHPAFSRSCDIYKRGKEILKIKHKRKITFLKTRRILGSYVRENTYTSVAQRVDPIRQSGQTQNSRLEDSPIRTKWLAKVSGKTCANTHRRPPISQLP